MPGREMTYPCPSSAARRSPTLRLWLYRAALSLLCRLAFAGQRWHHGA